MEKGEIMTEWIEYDKQKPIEVGQYWVCYESTELCERCCSFDYWGGDNWIQQLNCFTLIPKWWCKLPGPPLK